MAKQKYPWGLRGRVAKRLGVSYWLVNRVLTGKSVKPYITEAIFEEIDNMEAEKKRRDEVNEKLQNV